MRVVCSTLFAFVVVLSEKFEPVLLGLLLAFMLVKVSQLNSGLLHSNFWYLRINASMPEEFMPQLLHKIQGVRRGATNVENQANNGDQHVS